MADPTNSDVIASSPRPTVADQPARDSHVIATDAELNEASNCGWAEATIDGGDQETRSLRAVADLIASRLTPPTLPADLRGLLDALVAAKDAIDAGDLHDLGHILRLEVYEDAVRAVAEWHRGAGGGR